MADKNVYTFEQFVSELNSEEKKVLVTLWYLQTLIDDGDSSLPTPPPPSVDPKGNDEVKKVADQKTDR
ncbi:hypothetical protein R3W88_028962 [Solanum pinnatisectum]|uniref:Uncharacterized protein n=1 Tax=Solanum pinnatisectum TaxID=50273 RepID=A0AAV9K468_9SOLN|nr:hypothetical protein R3W88_028962 [Solanum pinnatisectum]